MLNSILVNKGKLSEQVTLSVINALKMSDRPAAVVIQ